MNKALFLFSMFIFFRTFAASEVTYLNIDGYNVRFAIHEQKNHLLPSCVHASTKDYYSFSLDSEPGRAMYSLLITAIAGKLPIMVDTANDCISESGVERTKGISLAVKPSVPDSYKGVTMIYKGDGVTKVGRFIDMHKSQNYWWIIKPGDNSSLGLYTPDTHGQAQIIYSQPNCTGTGYSLYPRKYLKASGYQDGQLFKALESSRKRINAQSWLLQGDKCEEFVHLRDVYDLVPTTHPVCGSKGCFIRDE